MTTLRRLEETAGNYTESRPDETIDAYPVREDREVLTYGDARALLALVRSAVLMQESGKPGAATGSEWMQHRKAFVAALAAVTTESP
jgi:hypothetical protein